MRVFVLSSFFTGEGKFQHLTTKVFKEHKDMLAMAKQFLKEDVEMRRNGVSVQRKPSFGHHRDHFEELRAKSREKVC